MTTYVPQFPCHENGSPDRRNWKIDSIFLKKFEKHIEKSSTQDCIIRSFSTDGNGRKFNIWNWICRSLNGGQNWGVLPLIIGRDGPISTQHEHGKNNRDPEHSSKCGLPSLGQISIFLATTYLQQQCTRDSEIIIIVTDTVITITVIMNSRF